MKITLIDNLTIIAHSQHENQTNDAISKCFVIIPYIQYLSLLLPSHGWNYWKYKDGYLNFIQKSASYFTITPFFEFQSNFIYYPVTILSLIVMIGLILYLSCFSLQRVSEGQKVKYLEGRSSTLSSYLLFVIQTLQIPCYKFYIQQIISADQSGQINQIAINIITIILYCIFIFVGEYFFRQYSFIPFHPMQQKFTKLRVTQFVLNLVTIVLELNNQSHFQHILALIILHSIFILKMLNHLYFKPEVPNKNVIHFKLSFLLESLTILLSLNVISENTIFSEKQLSVYMLFVASLSYAFGESLFSFLFQFNQDLMAKQLYQIYELYYYITNITLNSITLYHFKIYQLINDPSYAIFQKKITDQQKGSQLTDYYKLGLYLITEVFSALKQREKNEYEELHLLFISFLAQIRNKPLVAYVEFKKYENDPQQKSFYFRLIRTRIDLHLQSKISAIQKLYEKNTLTDKFQEKTNNFDTREIYQFYKIEEEFNQKVLKLAQIKISIWEFQIQGCKSLYDFEKIASTLSLNIIDCILYLRKQQINVIKEDFIKECDNILTLKVASVFHSFILNDYFASLACETKIQDLIKLDVSQESNIITKTSVIQDQTILIVISVVKQFGQILNTNKSLIANYFGYVVTEFEHVSNINELMPRFFGQSHDQLIQNYIKVAETHLGFEKIVTFSQGKDGFLIPQHIKVYNNFDYQDDFTLMGSLTKMNDASHYLIFDEYGKLIGITEQLSRILIPNDNLDFFLTNLDLFYIYMFIPHIHMYMNNILTSSESHILQKSVLIYIFRDLMEVQKLHQQIVFSYISQNCNEKTKICISQAELTNMVTNPQSSNQNRFLPSEVKLPEQSDDFKTLQLSTLDFFKLGYQNQQQPDNQSKQGTIARENETIDFLNALEILQKVMFLCTAQIQLKSLGKKSQRQHYFILELSEFVEKNIVQDEEKKSKKHEQRRQANRNSNIRSSFVQQYQQIPKSNEFQIEPSLLSPIGSIIQKKSFLDKSPANSQILHYVSERRLNLLGVLGKEKSESFSEEQQSNDVYQVLQHQNEYQSNHGLGILKSQSSGKSGSSGSAAIEIVNKFTKRTSLISSLTIISLVKGVAFILFLSFIFVNLAQIQSFSNQASKYISDINLPMNLNKYFLNVFTFAWISAMQQFDVLENSQFITNQMNQQFHNMQSTFSNLTTVYGNFIALEEKGFLEQLSIQILEESDQEVEVDYTYYIDFLQNIGFHLLHSSSQEASLTNLLKYRLNFASILTNNKQVILSLTQLYQSQQEQKANSLFTLVLVEIILIDLVLIIQVVYWYKIEQYCQKVLLLSCRLTEAAAEEQIVKFKVISQVIQQSVGELSWKQQNCHKLCYTNYSRQNRFKQRQSKIQTLSNNVIQQHLIRFANKNQKSFQSIPLNSRISNTSINLLSKIIFVLLIVILTTLYIIGDYLLFSSQTNNLEPTQDMAINYIQFSTNFDNTVAIACLVKTEQQMYIIMRDQIPESTSVINNYLQQHNTAKTLTVIYSTNHTILNQIYQGIIDSNVINGEDESYCLQLYHENFCKLFSVNEIPFCDVGITSEQFGTLYGQFSSKDNNSDYLSNGILGVVSKFDAFLQQQFEYEYTNKELNSDIEYLQQQLKSQQFNNIIVQHYLDTYLGLEAFFNKIQSTIISSIEQNMQIYSIYQYLLGFFLMLMFLIISCYIIIKVNLRLICIRLLITQLPIEIMLNIYTISLLKILK